ncbi:hypothetical protein FF098_009860 [Parvularcula flava]|uniref:Uncharacterized protein n=1 Tax=Aquisalinus luteolus TaxID=1566827 RepID=A0A8J3A770_9PROT|nr:hypothetical protein [Aquisalinus luteolus]NHK28208.1 hypothetical protein [Aquisalinus luteolus]GGH97789.1 hypothetical protein GCM10011355_19850 [Aquisalinus luteolus]
MNSIAFLMMLGIFAVLAYWYVRNAEAGRDGGMAPLALLDDDEQGRAEDSAAHLTGAAAIRAKVAGTDGDREDIRTRKADDTDETPASPLRTSATRTPQKQKAYRVRKDN